MSREPFAIAEMRLPGGGRLGLSPMPGRSGAFMADLAEMARWRPALVVSLTEAPELAASGAGNISSALSEHGIRHRHFPIVDFGVPDDADAMWPKIASEMHGALDLGQGVLVHCMGGCGRSGMVALRLLVERGAPAREALAALRAVRPCAVETDQQFAWASAVHHQPALRPK